MSFTCLDVAAAASLDVGRPRGQEQVFRCPRHDDQRPSLFVNVEKDVWMCGPCVKHGTAWALAAFVSHQDPSDTAAVTAWLRDHGVLNGTGTGHRATGSTKATTPKATATTTKATATTTKTVTTKNTLPFTPDVVYEYRGFDGTLLHYVNRLHATDSQDKRILPTTPDGFLGCGPGPHLPYRINELRRRTVLVGEGEPVVEALRAAGFDATTNAGGTGMGWKDSHSQALVQVGVTHVVVLPDNDEPGRKHAAATLANLQAHGLTAQIVTLPDLPHKGDAVDWLRTHSADDLQDVLASQPAPDHVPAPESDPLLDSWPEPKPIVAELKPVPTFDGDILLPPVLRDWVMDEADRMPCPPDFIAATALVALGSLIGARCAIKPKARDSWLVVPNLWGGIVGDPSAKKSPAWGAALKPLDRLIARALEDHQAAGADHDTAQFVFDAQREALKDRVKEAAKKPSKGDPAEIAKELRAHGAHAPEAPVLRRYKTNDSTVEKLGELLRENPAGLLMLRDELVGLLVAWEREGREGDRAFFLEAWNGDQSFDTDRIGRGHISISNLCVSVFGGIQPDKLTVYLEQAAHALANDGMLQRFQLLVYPDPLLWEWRDRAPNKPAREAAVAVFDALANLDPVALGAAPVDDLHKFPFFHFDREAQDLFIAWSEDLHRGRLAHEDEPLIQQHLAKFDKLCPALALIFHLVECVSNGVRGPVTQDAALRAAAWCEFLEAHARRCYGLLKDDGLRAAQALAAKLVRGALDDGFTVRDIRRNQWRHLTSDEAIQAALDWLEDEDWLRSESTGGTGPGSGRRTVRYHINPAVQGQRHGDDA